MKIFTPDFNTDAISLKTRFTASHWYMRMSVFFSVSLVSALIITIIMGVVIIGGKDLLLFTQEHLWVQTLLKWTLVLLLVVGTLSTAFGLEYYKNKKFVMQKYLEKELKTLDSHYQKLLKSRVKGVQFFWSQLGIKEQRKLIMEQYRNLSEPKQLELEDEFLDILNKSLIKLHKLPNELYPSFPFEDKSLANVTSRIATLQVMLNKL